MSKITPDTILAAAQQELPRLQEIRHHLHRYPELSFREKETQRFVQQQLETHGIRDIRAVAGTGLLARIGGDAPGTGPVIVLRADMDALPLTEANEVPYRSEHAGVMHACGHDVHMTCLLGAARLLTTLRRQWTGTVLLLFQPAEEKLPGGAKEIVASGILDRYEPSLVIGQHVDPTLPAGTVGYRPGRYMASADELYVTIRGHGGHAALPASVTNTPYVAARVLTALEDHVEKHSPEDFPSVLRFGKVTAAGATNIIPPEVKMEGTFRTFDESWRTTVHKKITEMTRTLAAQHGAEGEILIKKGYPVLINDEEAVKKALAFSSQYLGADNIRHLDLRMTAEDFAYYSHRWPSLFFRLGVTAAGTREPAPLHAPHFDIHEPALATGTGHLTWLTLSFLGATQPG